MCGWPGNEVLHQVPKFGMNQSGCITPAVPGSPGLRGMRVAA